MLAALAAVIVVGALGGTLTDTTGWYQTLTKPAWQPPDILFAPAWTLIYALCVASFAIGWRAAPSKAAREWLIGLFALNGFLNVLWSLLFFRLQRPDWAGIEVVALWLSIAGLIIALWRTSRTASLLLLPYLAWVSFASVLTWAITALNGPFR